MRVVIGKSIRKREFKRGNISSEDLQVILHGYAKGVYTQIKGESLPKNSRLIKLYMTTIGGARRIVFLVDVKTNIGYLLFCGTVCCAKFERNWAANGTGWRSRAKKTTAARLPTIANATVGAGLRTISSCSRALLLKTE